MAVPVDRTASTTTDLPEMPHQQAVERDPIPFSPGVPDKRKTLAILLTHKIKGTLPPHVHTPQILHENVKRLIVLIRDEPRYEKRKFRARNETFEHLKDLVWQWEDDSECTEKNREELSVTLRLLQKDRRLPRLETGGED